MKKATILLSLLLSAAVLTACGSKESGWSPSSSSAPSSQTVSSSTASSSQISKLSSSSSQVSASSQSSAVPSVTETSSSESSVVEQETQESSTSPVTSTNYASDFDLDALVAGDYTSLVGTWANAQGNVITITVDGKMEFWDRYGNYSTNEIVALTRQSDGHFSGGVGYYQDGEPRSFGAFAIFPAGVENALGLVSEFDHIEIGQSMAMGDPEQQYYRQ